MESTVVVPTSSSTAAERTSLAEETTSVSEVTTPVVATTATRRQSTETITSEIPEPLYTTAQETTEADTTISASTQIATGEK